MMPGLASVNLFLKTDRARTLLKRAADKAGEEHLPSEYEVHPHWRSPELARISESFNEEQSGFAGLRMFSNQI